MYSVSLYVYLVYMVLSTQWSRAISDCNVVSKKEWGGAKAKYLEYLARPLKAVVVLATGTDSCSADASCEYILKNIQEDHINKLGYGDIAPAFLVGSNGKIYEGSGWFHEGNHTKGYGRVSIGIAFIGTFKNIRPTIEALDAIQELLACGVSEGHITADYMLFTQSQLFRTYKEEDNKKLYTEIKRLPHWTYHTPWEWLSINTYNNLDYLASTFPFKNIPSSIIEEIKEELHDPYKARRRI